MQHTNYFLISVFVWVIDIINSTIDDKIILENSKNKRDTPLAATNADLMTSEFVLSISAKNVADEKTTVNPICVVYIREPESKNWTLYAQTEVVMGNRDPVFESEILITHRFGTVQPLKFQIYTNSSSAPPSHFYSSNSLGYSITSLAKIIGVGSDVKFCATQEDRGSKTTDDMFIFVTIKEERDSKEQVVLELEAEDLWKKWTGFFKNLRPFIEIQRHAEEGEKNLFIYKTEVLKETSENFRWRRFVIPCKILSNKNIKFTIRNWHPKKKHDPIGEFETSLDELHKNNEKKFPLKCPKNKILSGGNCGYIRITYFKILSDQSFIQSIFHGTKLRTIVGIDFSYENYTFHGHTYKPNFPSKRTIYEQSLDSILSILEEFDPEKRISVYGYPSARSILKPEELFCVNGKFIDDDPVCGGKDDVLGDYRDFIRDAGTLYEDVNPAPAIIQATKLAKKEPSNYHILLLLTTGYFYKPEEYCARTIEAIKQASLSPMSIVIIGMGFVEFPLLQDLIKNVNEQLDRDMLTFVTYKQFSSINLLAKEALSKIPLQIMSYKLTKRQETDSTIDELSSTNKN